MKIEKIKILHLEDTEEDFAYVQRLLTQGQIQFTSQVVDNREDYVAALRDFVPHLVISDHSMPSFNSLEALDILRTSGLDIPFILLTGAVSEGFAAEVLLRGADDYILKDRPKRLPAAIINSLEKYRARRAEEQYASHLRDIFEGSLDVLCSIDRQGRFISASPASEKILGYKPGELTGKKLTEIVIKGDHVATQEMLLGIMSGIAVTNYDNHCIHKNGSIVPMNWSARWNEQAQSVYAVARDATDKVKAEKAALTERKRLKEIFSNAPLNICMFKGEDHVVEMVNKVSDSYINSEVIGKKYRDAFPEFIQQGFADLMDKVYIIGEPFEAKEMLIKVDPKKDGNLKANYLNILLQPYRDSNGNVEGICYFGMYVTEQVLTRKKIEDSYEKLKSAEALQSSILNALPVQVALLDSGGNIIAINPAWKSFIKENNPNNLKCGLNENYIEAVESIKGSSHKIGKKMATGIRDVISGSRKSFSMEYRCDTATEKRWFTAKVAATSHGLDKGAVIVHTNITDRKLAEEKTKESEANLTAIIENSDALIYSLDRDFRYITFNNIMKTYVLTKYGIEINTGDKAQGFFEITDPEECRWWENLYTEALKGKKMQFIKDYSRSGTPHYMDFSINPIVKNTNIIGLACFAKDITSIKLAENKIRELNENLERRIAERTVQLNEAIKELEAFNYTVSHDLQSPLRVVSCFVSIILADYWDKLDETGKECLKHISDNTKKMSQLIKDLLDFARLGEVALHKQDVDINELVDGVIAQVKTLNPAIRAVISVNELPSSYCDIALFKQVWDNLILNAIKYSNKKENPMIEIGTKILDTRTAYYVRDNGIGFDMDKADNLFGVFKRLHSSLDFEGSGIGLATVHRIVTKHGGNIWAEARINEGATFYFTIPNS